MLMWLNSIAEECRSVTFVDGKIVTPERVEVVCLSKSGEKESLLVDCGCLESYCIEYNSRLRKRRRRGKAAGGCSSGWTVGMQGYSSRRGFVRVV